MEWLKQVLAEGYTEDLGRQIAAHIGREFVSRTDFNAVNSDKKELAAQLAGMSQPDVTALQQQIAQLEAEKAHLVGEHENQLAQLKRDAAIDAALEKSGAKNVVALRALLDLDQVVLGEDGLDGLEEQLADIRDQNEFLFAATPSATGLPHGREGLADPFLSAALSAAGLKKNEK